MLFLGLFDDIGTIFLGLLRQAVMSIIANLYNLIATFYNIFMYITKVNILTGSNESLVSDIYNRIQVILAVVMVFYVTLEFVKYIVNPDTFADKEKGGGGLLKRILIVIVLMAFTPQIFGIAYDLQSRVINSEVIPKVLIKNYDSTDFNDNAGGVFSSNLLGMFYKPFVTIEGNSPKGTCADKRSAQQVVNDNLSVLKTKGKMVNATYCISTAGDDVIDGGEKHQNPFLIEMGLGGLLPLAIGCFIFWILINYCAEAARVIIQFVFLQIIAPVPILSYIAPGKDGMFNKWIKQCITTYLDLFIRLFIMYLVLMLAQVLLNLDIDAILGSVTFPENSTIPFWVKLFLLVGLLMFAYKAPNMIKELLPGGSNAAAGEFGLGKEALKKRYPAPVARAAGMARGALGRGLNSVTSRAGKNLASAFKNLKKAHGVKKHSGVGYQAQFRDWRNRRNQDRKNAKVEKENAKNAKKQALAAEGDAIRTRNSSVGQLVRAEAELNKAMSEKTRYEYLRSKTNRTARENEELRQLEHNKNQRDNNIKNLQGTVNTLNKNIDVRNLTTTQSQLYDLYNATKAYEKARGDFDALKPSDAGYAQAQAELNDKAQALRNANNAYNSKTISSLTDAQTELSTIQDQINNTSDAIKTDYSNLTQLKTQYDQIADKNSASAVDLKNKIETAEAYGEVLAKKSECENNILQIHTDLQDISSQNLTAARLEEKIKEANKSYEAAVDTFEQKKRALMDTPYGTVGTVVSGVGKTIAGTFGIAKDVVVGGAVGTKTTDITKIQEDYKKNLASFVAERNAKEEMVANFGEPTIMQSVTGFVQGKYNKFAKEHALPTTTYGLNSEITEREVEIKDVKAAATASQNVVSDLSSANKSAQEFIVNQKANQKVSSVSVEVMGRKFDINNMSLTEFRNSFVDETDRIKREVSKKEQEIANLRSQLYTLPIDERTKAEKRIDDLTVDTNKLISDYQNRERALPDLDKKLGKVVERMAFDGQLVGVTDASILSIPEKLREIFKILRRDTKTMELLSKNMDDSNYSDLLNLDIDNADFDTFDKLKDAIELAGVNLQTYERDLSDQVSARKAKKEQIELREKLNNAGSNGSSSGK